MSYAIARITHLRFWRPLLLWIGLGFGLEPCFSRALAQAPLNIVWPRALVVPLAPVGGALEASHTGTFGEPDESRWFKFRIEPGSRVVVTLDELGVGADLVLFKDIARTYQALVTPADLPLLDAEFADDAFSPAQFSPAQFSPAQFSPAAFSPAQFSPAQFSPAQFSPAQFSPAQFSPAQFSPDAYAPAQFSPAQFSPAQFSPAQFSPAQFSPAQFSPAQFSEEAYASAQTRSVIAVSAFPGLLPEGVVANTWNEDTEFYVRVRLRDPVGIESSFRLSIYLFPGLCSGLTAVPTDGSGQPLPPSTVRAHAGGFRTLVITDLDRLVGPGPSLEREALTARLGELTARPEVRGVVVDVETDPWVAFFQTQADQNPQCPYAKNLVAEAIRSLVNRSRDGNDLEYVVLIGGDGVIPFFRLPDEAMLGPELGYVPPVLEFSPSQASLRHNFYLSQDRFGARCEISRKLSRISIPDLAVGRLVETPLEILEMLAAYLENPGGVRPAPTSILVTGYDFLQDAADSIAAELQAGSGVVVDRLITPRDLAPADPESWSAGDLEAAIFGKRHDVLFLAGHFSAGATLAADYRTAMPAFRLFDAPSGFFRNCLFYSAGCHSGYNIVDDDAVPEVTIQPDWAQTAARLGMTLIAGTGYQYGDTDFIEYSERLYLDFTRQLRSGVGPVPIGKALVRAKIRYLESVADLRGIHEKSLFQASLFGLPMFAIDMPGPRLPATDPGPSVIASTSGYPGAPGNVLGLRYADLAVFPELTPHTAELRLAEESPGGQGGPRTVIAKWYSGRDGVVAHPAEPVLPLEVRNVHVPDLPLRGVGFRGGVFSDETEVIPLTSAATTEIRGVHPAFLSDVFFPPKFWRPNYFGVLCDTDQGATRLVTTPAQFQSDPADEHGTFRTYGRLQFRLFYSANIQTYSEDTDGDGFDDAFATPALSGPPQINDVQSWSEPDRIRFRVQVTGNPAAGIQETWITYTSVSGARRGTWAPLDLAQDPADSRFWEGSIPTDSRPPEDLRFMVQSVNGVGLVALSANLGSYFVPNRTALPTVPLQPTTVQLVQPPSGGAYGDRITVQAKLLAGGNPVPGELMHFRLGGLLARALTGPDGIARIDLHLLHEPSSFDQRLSAQWLGSSTLAPASDSTSFLLGRSPTTLALPATPPPITVHPLATETLDAALADHTGRPLAEQTVVFVVEGSGGIRVVPRITDYSGRAALGWLDLPAGEYQVTAFFGQAVQPPAPFQTVGSPSPLFEPSSDSASLTLDLSVPRAADDEVEGQPGKPLKISAASLLGNDIDPGGSTLRVSGVGSQTGRAVPVTLSGSWVLLGTLPTGVRYDAFEYEITNAAGKSARARCVVRIRTDEAPSSNFLGMVPDAGRLRMRFAGIPGRIYRIQFSRELSPPNWQTIGQARVGSDGTASFLAPAPAGDSGYFRTVYP